MKQSLIPILIFGILNFFFVACKPKKEVEIQEPGFENIYECGAENINAKKWKFSAKNDTVLWFGNVEAQNNECVFSGKHSLKLYPGHEFGFTTEIDSLGPDELITIEVWRKSQHQNGAIIMDGGPGFYFGSKKISDEVNGWQKVYMEVITPPTFKNEKAKIFVWNNSADSVYFDDLKITHRNSKIYPDYNEVDGLVLYAEQADLNRFQQKRMEAFETSVLVNSDEDYSNVVLFNGKDFLNGSFRLKGDLLDHIQGKKWSFRIKLKKDFAWKNLLTFSIQNPATRNFLHEWVAHQLFLQEDVLTTRYGFVPVRLNNESLGIYAWEEHFEKQLIESQNRREGPIVRFDESLFWQRVLETNQTQREWDVDYFDAAKIIPFKEGSTSGDSLLNLQLVEAQKLLLQYKNLSAPVAEIFDINKLAKYYALIDITQAYHGFTWHNQRFYYNPVTCLLEPIAFDGYIEGGIYRRFDEQISGLLHPAKISDFKKEELLLFQVFADKSFQEKYVQNLYKYSQTDFIAQFISEKKPQTDSVSILLNKEFPTYSFNFNDLKWQAEYIQNHFSEIKQNVVALGKAVEQVSMQKFGRTFTSDVNKNLLPFLVHAYYNEAENKVDILNFHGAKITVLGVFVNNGLSENFDEKSEIEAFDGLLPSKISVPVSGKPVTLLFEAGGEMLETEISQWAYSTQKSTRQNVLQNQLPKNIKVEGNQVIFDGNYQFFSDVVIPDSMLVLARPGTKIDLKNGAAFFSFSPIYFEGNENSLVVITSSDKSANGFNVLQASEKSSLKYVQFSNLSSIKKAGWQTPAAVTFYESDVDFDHCTFKENVNCDDALNVVRSTFDAQNCWFENTFADAFDSDFCRGKVINCTFKNIGNDAIDFSGSRVFISDCKMSVIGDKAISGGEHSNLEVSSCSIEKANIGVASKDLSELTLDKITMNTTIYGLVAFVKKPEYGPAKITINNLKMKKNIVFHQIEEGSSLMLNGKKIQGREKKLALKLYQ